MKESYEFRTRFFVPRRTYTIIRLDGKAFHTYTRGLTKPFDSALSDDIDTAVINLMPHLQGAVFAYAQSDEISVLLTDFRSIDTSTWFDGNIQKMASVSASIMTAEFNKQRWKRAASDAKSPLWDVDYRPTAYFDARVFTIPDRIEVMNYFIWRNQDCSRNSLSMVAQSHFSHKQLHGKSSPEMHQMLHEIGVNWATDYSDGDKNGRIILRKEYTIPVPEDQKHDPTLKDVQRTRWESSGAWKFTEDKDRLLTMVPKMP